MKLSHRGGHLTGEKIQPKNADGHVQALRLQLIAKDLDKAAARWVRKDKAGGEGRGICGNTHVESNKEVVEQMKEECVTSGDTKGHSVVQTPLVAEASGYPDVGR